MARMGRLVKRNKSAKRSLEIENQIYPALFVIRYKSLNRSKTINGANL